jgi:hypothetical protein
MRPFQKIKDTEEDKARARLLAYSEDNPGSVFYSRQLEVPFEREYFDWVTNRALRGLIEEGRVHSERRQLGTGSEIKLIWHRSYRFYKRAADYVFNLADWYTSGATDGALGMQGEHLLLACFRSPEIFAHWRRSQQLRRQNVRHEARSRLHFRG